MVNSEFTKYVPENMFQKYSGKSNLKIIFKRGKMLFSENDEVKESIC